LASPVGDFIFAVDGLFGYSLAMNPATELEIVRTAIMMGRTVTGCCEWEDKAYERLDEDASRGGLTPDAVRLLLITFVVAGGTIHQVKEQRPEYNDYEYYYKVVIPVVEYPHGLFVELRLHDPDIDCPTVYLVNAHEQRR
jgi:hypothetical protein